jgi:hypothetical protein
VACSHLVCLLAATGAFGAVTLASRERLPVQHGTVTVSLASEGTTPTPVQIFSRGGAALTFAQPTQQGSAVVIPADHSVVVKEDKPVLTGPPLPPPPLPTTQARLPGLLIDSVQAPEGQRDIRGWALYLHAVRMPLTWDATRKAYTTRLRIGLQRSNGDGSAGSLDKPLAVQLLATDAAVDPDRLVLTGSGVEGFLEAVLSVTNHDVKPVVTAQSDLGEQTFSVATAPQLAGLDLQSSLTSIVGFGIGTSTLSLVRRAEDGMEMRIPGDFSVPLSARGGSLQDASLTFAPNSSRASTVLRSAFIGNVMIHGKIDNVQAGPITVSFTTPWSSLLAIVLGAALGSFARVQGIGKDFRVAEFAAGVFVGCIASAASFVGISVVAQLPTTAVVTEAGCFVVAAFGAYGGRALLDRLMPNRTPAPVSLN